MHFTVHLSRRLFALLAWLLCAVASWVGSTGLCRAQDARPENPSPRLRLQEILGFEAPARGTQPHDWRFTPDGTISFDSQRLHSGLRAVRFERRAEGGQQFSTVTTDIPMDFAGTRIELRGFLRTENVSGFFGLWMREDGETVSLALENMQKQALSGTHDWMEYSITLPLHPDGKTLYFGVLLVGSGTAWADDLQLLVDGRPISEVPQREVPNTVIDDDHQFDLGSGIALRKLSNLQIRSLVSLGKIWGFLKYHHPAVTSGKHQWDFELFRVLPAVLAARRQDEAHAIIASWVARLGEVSKCNPCVELKAADLHLRPRLDWLSDKRRLSAPLRQALVAIHRNRIAGTQFYVSLVPDINNPSFDRELAYGNVKLPDAGFQLLALYRFWNIIEYWFPYRDVMDEDWDEVLGQFVPRIALARSRMAYERELMALIARAHDSHAKLWTALDALPPVGDCRLPVSLRFLGEDAVVSGYIADGAGGSGLQIGDIVKSIDGVQLPRLIGRWAPYYAASNETARRRDIANSLTRGECGSTEVRGRRGAGNFQLQVERLPRGALNLIDAYRHDLPGETFRRLSDRVAYLKLSSVKAAEAASYIERAAGTEGLIIDIRNYPSEPVMDALGSLLVEKDTEFAHLTHADLSNPGAFYWWLPASLSPAQPHYSGRVVILVDETSMSRAEYTTMALRVAPGAVVVGSTTTGADGNTSPFPLPGGHQSMISGLGIYYPDRRPTQRVGIVPDVFVTPTIEGIRDHRDEALEAALRQILGDSPTTTELTALYQQ